MYDVHIIDDDDGSLNATAFLLRTAGLRVAAYTSAEAFLDTFSPTASGVILTDLRMPDMDGIELIRRVRSGRGEQLIVLMTGHGDEEIAGQAREAGAAVVLEKPFRASELLAAVRPRDEPAGGPSPAGVGAQGG